MKRAKIEYAGDWYEAVEAIGLALTVCVKPAALQKAILDLRLGDGYWRSIRVEPTYRPDPGAAQWIYRITYSTDVVEGERVQAGRVAAAARMVEAEIEQALEVKRYLRMLDHDE